MLTANAISGARDSYIKQGFEDYLSKPIAAEELENMLKRYLPEEKTSVKQTAAAETRPAVSETADGMDRFMTYIGGDDKLYDAMHLLMNRSKSGK